MSDHVGRNELYLGTHVIEIRNHNRSEQECYTNVENSVIKKESTLPCCQKKLPGLQKLYALLCTSQLHESYNTFVIPLYPPEDSKASKIHHCKEDNILATYRPNEDAIKYYKHPKIEN